MSCKYTTESMCNMFKSVSNTKKLNLSSQSLSFIKYSQRTLRQAYNLGLFAS